MPIKELTESLEGRLPPYMMPDTYAPLDALPLGPNGKLDKKKLEVLAQNLPKDVKPSGGGAPVTPGGAVSAANVDTSAVATMVTDTLKLDEAPDVTATFESLGADSIDLATLETLLRRAKLVPDTFALKKGQTIVEVAALGEPSSGGAPDVDTTAIASLVKDTLKLDEAPDVTATFEALGADSIDLATLETMMRRKNLVPDTFALKKGQTIVELASVGPPTTTKKEPPPPPASPEPTKPESAPPPPPPKVESAPLPKPAVPTGPPPKIEAAAMAEVTKSTLKLSALPSFTQTFEEIGADSIDIATLETQLRRAQLLPISVDLKKDLTINTVVTKAKEAIANGAVMIPVKAAAATPTPAPAPAPAPPPKEAPKTYTKIEAASVAEVIKGALKLSSLPSYTQTFEEIGADSIDVATLETQLRRAQLLPISINAYKDSTINGIVEKQRRRSQTARK